MIIKFFKSLFSFIGPLHFGGGGGGGAPANTTTTSIPEYARPYVENMLGAAQGTAFNMGQSGVDSNGNPTYGITGIKPYQQYGGQLTAGRSPLTQQAMYGAAGMNIPGQIGAASDLASQAGLAGLQSGNYSAGQFQGGEWDQNKAQQYMSPYMQSVVDINKNQALRDAAAQGTQRSAQFSRAGAFGGSRQGIADAEASRNLNQQLQDIQNKGMQDAYTTGMQGYQSDAARGLQAQQMGEQSRQFGANLGMQGIQNSLQAAQTLGQLGGTQLQGQLDINKQQQALGQQAQSEDQKYLDAQYQQWANAQNNPYKQLGFMSDLLRGLPLSNTSVYQAQPSGTSGLAGLGLAGLGLYNSTR